MNTNDIRTRLAATAAEKAAEYATEYRRLLADDVLEYTPEEAAEEARQTLGLHASASTSTEPGCYIENGHMVCWTWDPEDQPEDGPWGTIEATAPTTL